MINKINWKPTNRDLRNFGLVLLVGFGVLGSVLFFKGKVSLAYSLWSLFGCIGLLALVVPSASKPFYFLWMMFGACMGAVMSRVVMTIIFYVVLTPVALFFRVTKRDELKIRAANKLKQSYWENLPTTTDPASYDHLY